MEATAGQKRKERKKRYKAKFERALQEYKNVLVVTVDNVGSLQLQKNSYRSQRTSRDRHGKKYFNENDNERASSR